MADPFMLPSTPDDYNSISNDENIKLGLSGLLSPASAQTLVMPPPATAPKSGPAQTTPVTGSLATAPSQSQPRVSGPAMLPGIATKPENLGPVAQLERAGVTPTKPRGPNGPTLSDMNGVAAGNPLSMLHPSRSGVAEAIARQQPATSQASSPVQSLQQRWNGILNSGPQTRQAALINAAGPSTALPAMPASGMPDLGTPSSPTVIAPRGTVQGDQAEVNRLQNTGAGVDQIKNRWAHILGKTLDVAGSDLAPGWAQWVPGSTLTHERLLNQAEGRVENDQDQLQAAAKLADTQSQQTQRDAQAQREAAQAAGTAPVMVTPEMHAANPSLVVGTQIRPADYGRTLTQQTRNTGVLATHTGGQPHTLTAQDAALVASPALAGETISNDAWQRLLSGVQRNSQSGANNAANNQTRLQATGMRDATSTANNERTHAGKGAGAQKPIPAATRDRIESQKNTAINKARSDFTSGVSTQDDYLNAWQAAQNDYENRISTQTGQPVSHTDIRSNVDQKGNWIGPRQGSPQQPQAQQQPRNAQTFKSKTGSTVKVGDPVNVNGRMGTVSGINPRSGKVQVNWASKQ